MPGPAKRPVRGVSDAQLGWTHRNRQRRDRIRTLDEAMGAAGVDHAGSDLVAKQVFEAIAAIVDDDFRRNCTFEGVARGQVALLVEESPFMYNANWHSVLLGHLRRSVPRGNIRRIVFKERGNDEPIGATFPTPSC